MTSQHPSPTFHPDHKIGSRIKVKTTWESEFPIGMTGEIIGIASMNVIYHYIVLLDKPIEFMGQNHKAISIQGTAFDVV